MFLPQPHAGESSTDPVGSDDTHVTNHYNHAPVLKQLIPTRKNNHITGSRNKSSDKREYIDIPLPKSIIQLNLQNHDAKCARYNDYIVPSKSNVIKHYHINNNHPSNQSNSNECSCKTSSTDVDKHDISSNNR